MCLFHVVMGILGWCSRQRPIPESLLHAQCFRRSQGFAQRCAIWRSFLTTGHFSIQSAALYAVRYWLGTSIKESIYVLLAENLLIVCLVEWMPPFWTAFITVFAVSMGLAFYETRAEYMNPIGNVREINSEDSVEHAGVVTKANDDEYSLPSTSNLKSGMCPVRISSLIADTGSAILGTNSEKDAYRVIKPANDVKKLHGKPILFPCHLRHRRLTPFKDSFRHSYLYVRTPVGLQACYSPILCVDLPHDQRSKWPFRRAWFNIRGQDHAIRGGYHLTIAQKLRQYLISEVSEN